MPKGDNQKGTKKSLKKYRHEVGRICSRCDKDKALSYFHVIRKRDGWSGHRRSCKACDLKIKQIRRKKDPHKARRSDLRADLLKNYGLSVEQYEELRRKQNHVCAICGEDEKRYTRLAVDHDHDTGEVRGLLCSSCNSGIGMLRDSVVLCIRAANYLGGV